MWPVGLAVMTPPFQGGNHRFEPGTGYQNSSLSAISKEILQIANSLRKYLRQ